MTYALEQIPSGNWTGGRPAAILGTMVHTTVGTWDQTIATLTREGGPNPVSAHFVVALHERKAAQLVDIGDQAWHARSCNARWIGQEHVDDGNYDDPVRTPEQYETAAALIRTNHTALGIPIDATTVRRHKTCVNTACPDALDVERIINLAQGGADVPTQAEWLAHLADELNTANAIKDVLAALAHHGHGEPVLPPKMLRALRAVDRAVTAQHKRAARALLTKRTTRKPTRADVRAGHGR